MARSRGCCESGTTVQDAQPDRSWDMAELYVGGKWTGTRDGGRREIRCPADGRVVAEVDEATAPDVAAAVEAAREAFDAGEWSSSSTLERDPLLQTSWKVAPALAAGNTFVLKPSELTPSTAIHLMRLLEEAGVPPGVANLVLGTGADVGAPLVEDPRVDLVSFTGGLPTGKRIMAAASATVKKVSLELGGKNPNVVFADADLEA